MFVMRQIVKHEYIRISELSMRYVRDMPEYFRPDSWRSVAEDVKQGSGVIIRSKTFGTNGAKITMTMTGMTMGRCWMRVLPRTSPHVPAPVPHDTRPLVGQHGRCSWYGYQAP